MISSSTLLGSVSASTCLPLCLSNASFVVKSVQYPWFSSCFCWRLHLAYNHVHLTKFKKRQLRRSSITINLLTNPVTSFTPPFSSGLDSWVKHMVLLCCLGFEKQTLAHITRCLQLTELPFHSLSLNLRPRYCSRAHWRLCGLSSRFCLPSSLSAQAVNSIDLLTWEPSRALYSSLWNGCHGDLNSRLTVQGLRSLPATQALQLSYPRESFFFVATGDYSLFCKGWKIKKIGWVGGSFFFLFFCKMLCILSFVLGWWGCGCNVFEYVCFCHFNY